MRNWLLEIRKSVNMTQDEVSKEAGISREYYTRIESGQRGGKLPVPTAKKIAEVLNFDWTLFYEEKVAS